MALKRAAPGALALLLVASTALMGRSVQATGTTIVVNTAADTAHGCAGNGEGTCSLRDAITFANLNPGHDTIAFDIPGTGIHNLRPTSPLPSLTDSDGATLNGYTQEGARPNETGPGTDAMVRIEIDGVNVPGNVSGITIESNANTIRGVSFIHFGGAGIRVKSGFGNNIFGNFSGMDASGVEGPNARGIIVDAGVIATTIGSPNLADRNIISGNLAVGIQVQGNGTANTLISNNVIGANYSGLLAMPNLGPGILILDGAADTVVGGDADNANLIAYNQTGVAVDSATTIRNRVIGNIIRTNTGLGIDLGNNGITPNDEHDGDAGPNSLQNKPELLQALVSATNGQLAITGKQDSNPFAGPNRLDFYLSDDVAGSHGEGRLWLGYEPSAGVGEFNFATDAFEPLAEVDAGDIVTATATSIDGTSEFAVNLAVIANSKPVANAGSNQAALPKQVVTLNGSGSNDPDARPKTLTYQWTQTGGKPVLLSDSTVASPTFTPTQGGQYKFELVVFDGLDYSAVSTVTVSINDATPPSAIPQSVNAVGGETKSIRLTATDVESTSFIFKIVNQPLVGSIISINELTGVVLYSPPTGYNGLGSFTFTASDGINTSQPATVTITVKAGVAIETGILPSTATGRPFKFQLIASGGNGNYTWSYTGGIIPPGMTFGANGQLLGVPTEPGNYQFGVQVVDGNGLQAQRQVLLTVSPAALRPFRLFTMMAAGDQ